MFASDTAPARECLIHRSGHVGSPAPCLFPRGSSCQLSTLSNPAAELSLLPRKGLIYRKESATSSLLRNRSQQDTVRRLRSHQRLLEQRRSMGTRSLQRSCQRLGSCHLRTSFRQDMASTSEGPRGRRRLRVCKFLLDNWFR